MGRPVDVTPAAPSEAQNDPDRTVLLGAADASAGAVGDASVGVVVEVPTTITAGLIPVDVAVSARSPACGVETGAWSPPDAAPGSVATGAAGAGLVVLGRVELVLAEGNVVVPDALLIAAAARVNTAKVVVPPASHQRLRDRLGS